MEPMSTVETAATTPTRHRLLNVAVIFTLPLVRTNERPPSIIR
jgi:hypothetical protein